MNCRVVAIVPAAGLGIRMKKGDVAKQFLTLGGLSLLTRTCLTLDVVKEIAAIIVVVSPGNENQIYQNFLYPYSFFKLLLVVGGGYKRQDSVAAGCRIAAKLGACWVVIHDAVRPLACPELFSRVIIEAYTSGKGAAISVLSCVDTIRQGGIFRGITTFIDRENIWLVQTPQAFRLELLIRVQQEAEKLGVKATDEASLIEVFGGGVSLVKGERNNFKITIAEDLDLASGIINSVRPLARTGYGIDIHKFVSGRPLILGGLCIDFHLGLLGHSDADVLTHAVIDALLAAAGLGDIGLMFSDNKLIFKDANSLMLLNLVVEALMIQGWRPAQVSVTVLAQEPKISLYIQAIIANLTRVLEIDSSFINVAASTSENLGFIGRVEGIAVLAIATIVPI